MLDASVLIAYVDAADGHHRSAELLLTREDDNLAVNQLTLAEVLVLPVREGRLDLVLAMLRGLKVLALELPTDAAVRLARLRAATGLRMPDCGVLLSAEQEDASVATFDARLARVAEARGVLVLRG